MSCRIDELSIWWVLESMNFFDELSFDVIVAHYRCKLKLFNRIKYIIGKKNSQVHVVQSNGFLSINLNEHIQQGKEKGKKAGHCLSNSIQTNINWYKLSGQLYEVIVLEMIKLKYHHSPLNASKAAEYVFLY